MNTLSHVPPGYRFHPTDEELVDYYLREKVAARQMFDVIKDVDLYKIEPWDLREICKIGSEEQEQHEWYFFSHKDKKYPTGTRTNRATKAGFWKATGRDKAIYSKHNLIGMRKTLVFYKGRAPNGQKSDWIMHEYRIETNENGTPQEEGWVVCRVFKKRMATVRKLDDSPCWYDDQVSFIPDMDSPRRIPHHLYNHNPNSNFHPHNMYPCKQELEIASYNISHHDPFLQLPQLESPKMPQANMQSSSSMPPFGTCTNLPSSMLIHDQTIHPQQLDSIYGHTSGSEQVVDHVTDWRVLHKFVASQLSQDEQHGSPAANKELIYSNDPIFPVSEHMNMVISPNSNNQDHLGTTPDQYASTSASSCQIDMWK